jgi:hypothetical protein
MARVRRRLALVLSVALAVALTATASAGPRDPKTRFTKAGQALARRAVVHLSDLSGWKPIPPYRGRIRCRGSYDPDLSRFTLIGSAQSTFALSNRAVLFSRVSVYIESRQAAAAFQVAVTPGYLACASTSLLKSFARSHVGARIVSKTLSRGPPLGARHAMFRIVFSVSARSRTTPYLFEAIVFQVRKAIAQVSFQGYGRQIRGDLFIARRVANRLDGGRRT